MFVLFLFVLRLYFNYITFLFSFILTPPPKPLTYPSHRSFKSMVSFSSIVIVCVYVFAFTYILLNITC